METNTRFDSGYKNYKILKIMGSGSFGKVFAVADNENLYALKVFSKAKPSDLEKIEKEIDAIKKLNAPLTLILVESIFDNQYDINSERPWLLMDYIPGISLEKFAYNRETPIWFAYATSYIITKTVGLLHEQQIIHRDIKPENIIVDGSLLPHLLDFGEATEINKDGVKIERTGEHGTVFYAAPEVFSNDQYRDKTDVFSLGSTIYALVTSGSPFFDLIYIPKNDSILNSINYLEPADKDLLEKESHEEKYLRNGSGWYRYVCGLIKPKIAKGLVDTTYKPGSDKYQKLCKEKQNIIDIVFECWAKNPDERPSCDEIAHKILEASNSLRPLDKDMFDSFVIIYEKEYYEKSTHGTLSNLYASCRKLGCSNLVEVLKLACENDPNFDFKSDFDDIEEEFLKSILSLSTFYF
jgi:serine/threonine protein kinase